MFSIPSNLNYCFFSTASNYKTLKEKAKRKDERFFRNLPTSSTTSTCIINDNDNRVISSRTSIRYFALCIFHISYVFYIPTQTLGAVIPAMTLFGDDFGDGAATGIEGCCERHNVPELCRKTLCNPQRPPNDFEVYDVFQGQNNCSKFLKPISHCLAAGRDHSSCCERNAKDGDEHTCFSMCRGEDRCVLHEAWNNYQTCLAINIRSMFECFMNGYSNSPTPPRKLAVENVGATSARLVWHKPSVNARMVTGYIIYAYQLYDNNESENNDTPSDELYFETDEPRIELGSLEPGTKYRAYAVAIADDTHRSLRSKYVDFQTAGIAPSVSPFKLTVPIASTAFGSSALLACRYKVSGVSESSVEIKWGFRKSSDAQYAYVKGPRFNQTSFLYSATKSREYVALLEVKKFTAEDYGTYQCTISDKFGEGNAEVTVKPVELHNSPSATPPLTPLACCRNREVNERCLPMCGGPSTSSEISTRRYVPRPFMPSNCSGEISKVLSCSMPEVDDSACCLRQQVPRQCMYLCDSSVEPSNQMAAICLHYVDAVVQCRMAGVDKRPAAVTGLRVEGGDVGVSKTVLVSWNSAKDAKIYHVYWRRKNAEGDNLSFLSSSVEDDEQIGWHHKSQNTTSRMVYDADEIVVVAANHYGNSQASKIAFDGSSSKWTRAS